MAAVDPALAIEVKALSQWREVRVADERGDSDIQTLFKGAVVFITGGTGFLGKQLTEKLFRSCRDIKKVYLLSRSKKGKTMQERLSKILKDAVFDQVRERAPDFESRIVPVEGDMLELRLGIKDEDWKTLLEEVNFIYHVAATVRFDEPLKTAILANVRGTKEVLALARECRHLRSFVHVSTAYSHCNRKEVAEKFYDSPVPPQTMIEFVENVEEARIEALTPALIEGWPNTYTFSKAIAEEAVRTLGRGLPVCVVRPAIVIPSYREPTPGWLDFSNVLGPSGMLLGTHVGLVHTMLMDMKVQIDVVPVDYVNNLIVAASWDTATRLTRTRDALEDCRVYTLSRFRNRVDWHQLKNHSETVLRRYVSPRTVWYCFALPTASRFLFYIYSLFLHFIPALVIDGVLALSGNTLRVHKIYDKAYKLNSVLAYFMLQTWDMRDDNTLALYNKLSKTDKLIFCFDMTTVEFPAFMTYWWLGLRKHIIKDDLKNTEDATYKQRWLKLANVVFFVAYFCLIWLVVSWLYSFVSFVGGQDFHIFGLTIEDE